MQHFSTGISVAKGPVIPTALTAYLVLGPANSVGTPGSIGHEIGGGRRSQTSLSGLWDRRDLGSLVRDMKLYPIGYKTHKIDRKDTDRV